MQAAGFYHAPSTRASLPYRKWVSFHSSRHSKELTPVNSYNTWMGDPIRALQAREIINVIKSENLLERTANVGDYLYSSLAQLAKSGAGLSHIQNLRGKDQGTFIAFDCETPAARDQFVAGMRNAGVNMGGCGERAVRLRPMLVFEKKRACRVLPFRQASLTLLSSYRRRCVLVQGRGYPQDAVGRVQAMYSSGLRGVSREISLHSCSTVPAVGTPREPNTASRCSNPTRSSCTSAHAGR